MKFREYDIGPFNTLDELNLVLSKLVKINESVCRKTPYKRPYKYLCWSGNGWAAKHTKTSKRLLAMNDFFVFLSRKTPGN